MTLDRYEGNQMKKREIRSIDYDEAYEILNEYLDSCKVHKKEKKKITKHTRRVVDICHQITNELESLGYHPDQELLDLSAIFHDIAKMENDEEHHKITKEVLENYFSEDDDLEEVCSIIKAHKGKFKPMGSVNLEAAVLRISDKIDKINKGDLNKFWKSYRESLKEIKKNFKKTGQYRFKSVKTAFDKVAVCVFRKRICFILD